MLNVACASQVKNVLIILMLGLATNANAIDRVYYQLAEPGIYYPSHELACAQHYSDITLYGCADVSPMGVNYEFYIQSGTDSCHLKAKYCPTGAIYNRIIRNGVLGYISNVDCAYQTKTGTCSATQPENQDCVDTNSATEPFYICAEKVAVCSGYQDCYDYAYTANNCLNTQDIADLDGALCYSENYDYTDDNDFSMACVNQQCITGDVDIDEWQNVEDFVLADNSHNSNNDVIDHADPTLGGGDGGSFGTGTGTGSGDTTDDPSNESRMLIDDSMIINAVDNQTSMLNEMLNQNTEEVKDSASSVTDAIGDLGSSGVAVGNALGSEIAKTNSLLDSIENEMLSEGRHVYDDNGYIIGVDRGANFESIFAQSPVSQALSNITGLINLGDLSCSPFSINLTSTIVGRSISTNVICEGFDALAPVISTVMIVLYMFAGFRIFAAA